MACCPALFCTVWIFSISLRWRDDAHLSGVPLAVLKVLNTDSLRFLTLVHSKFLIMVAFSASNVMLHQSLIFILPRFEEK
jgi:hypothetical protein